MKDKFLLITGANGGLGRAVLEKLLDLGWKVHASVSSPKSMERLKSRYPEPWGKQLTAAEADLRTSPGVKEFVSGCPEPYALVHLAGGFTASLSFEWSAEEDFDRMMELNAKPAFLLLREILPGMISRKSGAIVTVGSRSVVRPVPAHAPYTASKSALASLTLAAAEEGRSHGVTANCILPGVILTEANLQKIPGADREKWTSPEQIASLIAFLISEEGRSLTGSLLPLFGRTPG